MKATILKEKPLKYAKARLSGFSMKESSQIAGYAPTGALTTRENNKSVQLAFKSYKDVYLKEIGREEQASLLARNARQDKDTGGSNSALKILADRIEPETKTQTVENKVLVVIR